MTQSGTSIKCVLREGLVGGFIPMRGLPQNVVDMFRPKFFSPWKRPYCFWKTFVSSFISKCMPVLQLQALSCISYPRWSHPKSLGQRQEGLVMTHCMFHLLSAPLLDLWAHPLSGPALLLLRGYFPYQDQCPGLSMWRCQVGVKIL